MSTERQVEILRHALGINRGKEEYRNHFVTGPGSTDWDDCNELVSLGCMTKRPYNLAPGDFVFHLTELGKQLARKP